MRQCLIFALLIALSLHADGRPHRSAAIKAEFQRINPCPSTGQRRGACPGWEKEHTVPLKCGGADSVENMTWMRVEDHKVKTKKEAKLCRNQKSLNPSPK